MNSSFIFILARSLIHFSCSTLKVHAGNLDKKGEKNKSFKNIYIIGFSRPC